MRLNLIFVFLMLFVGFIFAYNYLGQHNSKTAIIKWSTSSDSELALKGNQNGHGINQTNDSGGSGVGVGPGTDVDIESETEHGMGVGSDNKSNEEIENGTGHGNSPQEDHGNNGENSNNNSNGSALSIQNQNNGVSDQIHIMVQQKQNGSLDVPQGMIVRIIARNHSLDIGNLSFQLNESLQLNFSLHGKKNSIVIELAGNGVGIHQGNASAYTNETIEIENETIYVGGSELVFLPSQIKEMVKAKSTNMITVQHENNRLVYRFMARREVRLFGIFNADMETTMAMDATNGEVLEQRGPWWAFLAFDSE
ncbi:MAG: hypothetical protein ABII39_00490 [Candidatus Micrarchaeota archaeon]